MTKPNKIKQTKLDLINEIEKLFEKYFDTPHRDENDNVYYEGHITEKEINEILSEFKKQLEKK
jgi:recombinational DNA repair ATPase RecF